MHIVKKLLLLLLLTTVQTPTIKAQTPSSIAMNDITRHDRHSTCSQVGEAIRKKSGADAWTRNCEGSKLLSAVLV